MRRVPMSADGGGNSMCECVKTQSPAWHMVSTLYISYHYYCYLPTRNQWSWIWLYANTELYRSLLVPQCLVASLMAMPSDWMNFFTLCVYPKLNSSWNSLFSLKITSSGKASLIPFSHPMWRCLPTRLSLYLESASTIVLMILNYDLFVHISVCLLEVRDYILFVLHP